MNAVNRRYQNMLQSRTIILVLNIPVNRDISLKVLKLGYVYQVDSGPVTNPTVEKCFVQIQVI